MPFTKTSQAKEMLFCLKLGLLKPFNLAKNGTKRREKEKLF